MDVPRTGPCAAAHAAALDRLAALAFPLDGGSDDDWYAFAEAARQRLSFRVADPALVVHMAPLQYDPLEKKYFKCLLPTDDTALNGLLEKRGDDLNIAIADDASTEVQSPQNYSFQTGIKPQPAEQTLTVAISFADKIVKSWGLKVEK